MPAVVAWIGEMLLSVVGQLVISALVSLGVGLAVHAGGSYIVGTDTIRSLMGQAGSVMLNYVGWFGIDTAMTMVVSACAGRMITDAARVHFVRRAQANT